MEIYNAANVIYFNGSHADFKSLSVYTRPDDRNNQRLEGAHNGAINLGKSDSAAFAKGSYLRWINVAQKEEVGFANREYQIEKLKSSPKKKDDKLVQKDKAIASWVRKHKRNEITFKVLFEKYMRLTSEKSLPRNLRHFSSDLN